MLIKFKKELALTLQNVDIKICKCLYVHPNILI